MARDLDVAAGRPMSLVAADRRPRRVALLSRTLRRAGMAVPVVALDATAPLPFGPVFDCVLLDAPCSGLGTLRRDPDLKWSRDPGDLPGLAASQRRMLAAAADAVRPGGRLVYATCSSEPDENAQVIDAFLESDGRYAPAPVPDRIPRAVIDARGCVTTVPFRDNQDAYFAAVLARRAGT
jgi:16S rRNA (cytosine967-C5)-methyltransferase